MKCVSAATEPGRASAFYADPGLDVWSRSRILCMAAHCPLPTLSVRNGLQHRVYYDRRCCRQDVGELTCG